MFPLLRVHMLGVQRELEAEFKSGQARDQLRKARNHHGTVFGGKGGAALRAAGKQWNRVNAVPALCSCLGRAVQRSSCDYDDGSSAGRRPPMALFRTNSQREEPCSPGVAVRGVVTSALAQNASGALKAAPGGRAVDYVVADGGVLLPAAEPRPAERTPAASGQPATGTAAADQPSPASPTTNQQQPATDAPAPAAAP